MKNNKKKPIILAVAHCLLNPEVRARGLSQHPEIKEKILKLAPKYNAKIEQLPCPEFLLLGEREQKTYDEYIKTKGFKELCKNLAEETAQKLKKFKGYNALIIVGIARSPSCSDSYVYDRNNNFKKGKGLFIELLRKQLPECIFSEIDYHHIDASIQKIEEILDKAIS